MLVELSAEEIKQIQQALKDSGIEYTNNLLLYDKLNEYVK
jgi:hypothetical protein